MPPAAVTDVFVIAFVIAFSTQGETVPGLHAE
jgi:hypothetical protein